MLNGNVKGYAAAAAACLIWGASFVATKVALQIFTPYGLLALRFAVASGFLLPAFFFFKREKLHGRDLGLFCLLGVMEPGLYFLCETRGLMYTSASVASLIIGSIPVFVMILGAAFLKEPVRLKTGLGVALTLVGIAFLVHKDMDGSSQATSPFLGNLLIMGAALCASVYTIVSRSLSARYRPMTLTTIQAAFATVFFALFAFADGESAVRAIPTAQAVISLLFLAFFATLAAFWLYNTSLQILPASQVAVWINLIPLVTVLTARIVLDETLSWAQLVGAVFILLGVRVSTLMGDIRLPSRLLKGVQVLVR
ncbi:MAG: DMT family transporter [Desulfosoma sp.]